jgi:hypothetical protein
MLACVSIVWVAVAPFAASREWATLGMVAALGSVAGLIFTFVVNRRVSFPLLAVCVVGLGMWRAGTALGDTRTTDGWALTGDRVRLQATVDAPVETRGTTAAVYARVLRVLQPANVELPPGRIRLPSRHFPR